LILLTGATGYIGSHTWVELLQLGFEVIGIDNLISSDKKVIARIEKIVGKRVNFYQIDVKNTLQIQKIFEENNIQAVLHFAGLKSVKESVESPLNYYENNVGGLVALLQAMQMTQCPYFIFSSSATVYHPENSIPYKENMPKGAANPYGRTKWMCEQILLDYEIANPNSAIALLRYFNPVGAHPSGLIGENPLGTPNNLMPYLTSVAVQKNEYLSIYGNDWNTPDGTCIRDYIHVQDLAKGHISALKHLMHNKSSITVNLGTGKGVSVLDLLQTFEKVTGKVIPYRFAPRRQGDIAAYFADVSFAKTLLDWEAQLDLQAMCSDSWNWQINNPNGY
jgi:UDP-glucose 4-epimerase